jgi:hypothetical protein
VVVDRGWNGRMVVVVGFRVLGKVAWVRREVPEGRGGGDKRGTATNTHDDSRWTMAELSVVGQEEAVVGSWAMATVTMALANLLPPKTCLWMAIMRTLCMAHSMAVSMAMSHLLSSVTIVSVTHYVPSLSPMTPMPVSYRRPMDRPMGVLLARDLLAPMPRS